MNLKYFYDGFSPGSVLKLQGYVHADPDRFEINLQCGPVVPPDIVSDIALHFNPRFDEESSVIVRNTKRNGFWGYEEQEGGFFFSPNKAFSVHIYSEWRGYKIVIDDFPFIYYKHRQELSTVTHMTVQGDVEVREVIYNPAPKLEEVIYVPKPSVPYKLDLIESLKPGRSVEINGRVRGDVVRFAVNLICGKSPDYDDELCYPTTVALHYDVRFHCNSTVRNTMVDGEWGEEETDGGFRFSRDSDFSLRIDCQEEQFKIYVDKLLNTTYRHRINPCGISYIYIHGEIYLSDISIISL